MKQKEEERMREFVEGWRENGHLRLRFYCIPWLRSLQVQKRHEKNLEWPRLQRGGGVNNGKAQACDSYI